jgi:hypothetical protein
VGQGSVGNAGELIEEQLCFAEFSGIEQADGSRKDTQIAGALVAIRAIRFVTARGCFLHRYVLRNCIRLAGVGATLVTLPLVILLR